MLEKFIADSEEAFLYMGTLEERIEKSKERLEQLKHQQKMQEKRELDKQKKIDNRRKFTIGELILKYFPEASNFQPRRTTAENEIEFKSFIDILILLANNPDIVKTLKTEASKGDLNKKLRIMILP